MTVRHDDLLRSARGLLRGAYPGIVTALASALLVLLLWPQPEQTFVAEAIAAARGGSDISPSDVEAWPASDEVLRAAATNVRAAQPREMAYLLTASAASDPVEAIRQRIELVPLASPDELPRVAIGCQAPRRRAALAIADELARQLAEHHAPQTRRHRLLALETRHKQAEAELQAAQDAEERLQVELQGLRHAQLASAVAKTPPTAVTAPSASRDMSSSELARTLEALKLERDRLLEIYLPAHPQIQSLSAQISRLEESLRRNSSSAESRDAALRSASGTPQTNTVLLYWRRDTSREAQASGEESSAASADPRKELASAIRQTQLQLLSATHRRQQAEETCRHLAEERRKVESAADIAWEIQPARIASASGGAPARQQLAAALIAATVGAVGIGWLAGREQRLTTAAEIRSQLALPVLGTVASGDSEPLPDNSPSPSQRAANLATRSAEVVLATFALTLLAAILLDRGLLAELANDPLATLGELVQRLI